MRAIMDYKLDLLPVDGKIRLPSPSCFNFIQSVKSCGKPFVRSYKHAIFSEECIEP